MREIYLAGLMSSLERDYLDAIIVRINSGAFKVGNRFIRTTSMPGISDLVFFHEKATVFIEYKAAEDKLNENQIKFQQNCQNKKLHYIVVQTAAEAKGYIEEVINDAA